MPALVKEADDAVLMAERRDLAHLIEVLHRGIGIGRGGGLGGGGTHVVVSLKASKKLSGG